jgi:hypothetical protein
MLCVCVLGLLGLPGVAFGYHGGGIVLLAFIGEPWSFWLSLGHLGRAGGSPCWLWGVGIFRMFQLVWSRGPD